MPRKQKREAHAITRILDRKTSVVVGWLYRWNTGERTTKWKNGIQSDVVYEERTQKPPKP